MTMNTKSLTEKVHSAICHQCQQRGYAAPVDVLMDIGVLTKKEYLLWRNGKVPYLEKVCTCNLHKLSFIMKQIRICAEKNGYKESLTYYRQWGTKKTTPLRFSKCGENSIEKAYRTHYVDSGRISELKKAKQED